MLVSADGMVLAVRGSDGRLSIHRTGRDTFAIKEWLAADGDARLPGDETLLKGFRCDESACMASLRDGKLVSQVIESDAFEEDLRPCHGRGDDAGLAGCVQSHGDRPPTVARKGSHCAPPRW